MANSEAPKKGPRDERRCFLRTDLPRRRRGSPRAEPIGDPASLFAPTQALTHPLASTGRSRNTSPRTGGCAHVGGLPSHAPSPRRRVRIVALPPRRREGSAATGAGRSSARLRRPVRKTDQPGRRASGRCVVPALDVTDRPAARRSATSSAAAATTPAPAGSARAIQRVSSGPSRSARSSRSSANARETRAQPHRLSAFTARGCRTGARGQWPLDAGGSSASSSVAAPIVGSSVWPRAVARVRSSWTSRSKTNISTTRSGANMICDW